MGTVTSDPSSLSKLRSLSFPAEDPGDLWPDPWGKVALLLPSAKGPQCPAPRAPAFPTAAATSGTNEMRSRAVALEVRTEPFFLLYFHSPGCTSGSLFSLSPLLISHLANQRYLAEARIKLFPGKRRPSIVGPRVELVRVLADQAGIPDVMTKMEVIFRVQVAKKHLPPSSYPHTRDSLPF